jgi:formyl-CoA transferase
MIGQATGGTMSITGKADCMPLKPGPTLGDTGTGMLATISILSALYKKKDTGEGQHIQLAMQDAMIQYCRTALSAQSATDKAAGRASAGSVTGGNALMGLYPCKPGGPNGFVYVYGTCADNSHCHRVLETIRRPDLFDDERYDTPKKRAAAKPKIEAMLIPLTQARTKEEAMISLGEPKVPAGTVFDTMELRQNANIEKRDIFQTIDHPTVGPSKIPVWPFEASGDDVPLKPPPLLGEHNEPVLTE